MDSAPRLLAKTLSYFKYSMKVQILVMLDLLRCMQQAECGVSEPISVYHLE